MTSKHVIIGIILGYLLGGIVPWPLLLLGALS